MSHVFFSHNAFRAPGAASIEDLREQPQKVDYFERIYSRMHRGVHAHAGFLDEAGLSALDDLDFVFICMDRGGDKRSIVEHLESEGIPFVDAGMGVEVKDAAVLGILTVTTSTPEMRDHVRAKKRIPFGTTDEADDYSKQHSDRGPERFERDSGGDSMEEVVGVLSRPRGRALLGLHD